MRLAPLPYTTSDYRSTNRSLNPCKDGAIISKRILSCSPLTLSRRMPPSRDPLFARLPGSLIPAQPSMAGRPRSRRCIQPDGVGHAGASEPPRWVGGFRVTGSENQPPCMPLFLVLRQTSSPSISVAVTGSSTPASMATLLLRRPSSEQYGFMWTRRGLTGCGR